MNTVETVLVILLGVGFLSLLILGIILVSIMIAIMKNVRKISERAEEATSNVAELASMIGRKVAPFALSGLAGAAMKWFKNKSKK